jgi:hypothetical protein
LNRLIIPFHVKAIALFRVDVGRSHLPGFRCRSYQGSRASSSTRANATRYAKLNMLMIYDNNQQEVQGEISDLLADMV